MSRIFNIKDNTIFSVNDDGSITTIATIDSRGEITPVNRRPYIHLEMELQHARQQVSSLQRELSKTKEELDKLRQRLQIEIKNKETIECELKQITPLSSELTWRKGVNDKLSNISSSLYSTRNTTSAISNSVENSTNWMKILMGGSVFLSTVIIVVLFFYTGSVKKVNNSYIVGKDSIVDVDTDSNNIAVQTIAMKKEMDLTKLALIIKDVKIANTDENGAVISDFGKVIDSHKTKYLMPQITYFGIKNSTTTLRVKWIMPDGSVSKGTSSIGDFSQIEGYNLSVGKIDKTVLRSWGNTDEGHWRKGNYAIEIWYDDIMLIHKQFSIK